MSSQMIMYGLLAVVGLFVLVIIAYIILMKRMNKSDVRQAMALKSGTESKSFSADVIYQKLYMIYIKTSCFLML